jgi:branched-chain amino acid transport system ATP-binding protein
MLRIDDLTVAYGKIRAVRGLSCEVADGQIVAVLGRNGAGKTTMAKAVCGLLPVRSGTVLFGDRRLDRMPTHKIVRCGVVLVPQGRELFPQLSVLDNLELGAYTVSGKKRVAAALDRVLHYFPRLSERVHQPVGNLSGGEQQMVAIGRALMSEPRLLLLDEPSAGLAPKVLREVFDIVARITADHGMSVLVAEQNAREALRVAHVTYLIENGTIVASAAPADLVSGDRLVRSYLGVGGTESLDVRPEVST